MREEKAEELDLMAMLRKADAEESFPDVPLDEFIPPTFEEWKEACEALLKGAPFEKKMFTKTYEGITFDPMYFRKDTEDILPKASFPGMDDFLRGARVNGYIEKPWGIAQACDETLPSENNKLLKEEASKGSTIYHIRLDRATRENKGINDEAVVIGDEGTSLSTLDDVHTLLAELDLEKRPLLLYAGASALPLLSMAAAALEADGRDVAKLRGIFGADPLGELVERGENYASLDVLYDEMAEVSKWSVKNAPKLRTVFVRSDVYSRGGANDVQEVAAVLATAVTYLRALMDRGLTIDEAAGQIAFGLSMGVNFFLQIAKLRALRPLWANIIKAFGGSEDAQRIHVHGRPASFFNTIYDPYVNMLRNTTEIFSGVVGGIDSYENAPFDEPIRKGDAFSRRIARNVQIMLQEEFGLLQPIDPAGGSWAVETLTKQMKERIWESFQSIEAKGGITELLKDGSWQSAIGEILSARFKAAELRRDRIVGNNMYPNMTEELLDPRTEDPEELKKAREDAILAYLSDIDEEYKLEKLADFRKYKGVGEAIFAAKAGATLVELRAVLLENAAVSEKINAILPHRWSERFEALRKRTETYSKTHDGDNVKVFLANMGPIPQHKARADFTTGFLQVGGFQVLLNDGFQTTDDAAAAAKESGADVCVICSTDATYPEIVPEIAPKLKAALPAATIYLAGAAPKELEPVYREAGVDDFISVRANCYQILDFLQKKKGMVE
ncbi:methylmalonyl-CoA mutase family protein [Selenomonas sp. TAMA-11512]|nr:methylmalonyl-CoA mutase family protein [Selenomonas sp. TAMA-11512]